MATSSHRKIKEHKALSIHVLTCLEWERTPTAIRLSVFALGIKLNQTAPFAYVERTLMLIINPLGYA